MSIGNIQITPQLVQAVRDAADIVEIASEHTRLRKAGRRHQGLCPLHKEKTPSFSVDPVQGLFYCFGCGVGGDAIKLHMLLTGDDFPAAIESLAKRNGIPLPVRQAADGSGRREIDLEAVLEEAADFFVRQLGESRLAQRYLEQRQISSELIDQFGLGFAPDGWRNLVQALQPRVPLANLEAAGLIARSEKRQGEPYDRFRNRLIFPIRHASGRLVGFGGRTLGDDKAKYINTNETRQFRKGLLLYGLDRARRTIRESGRALLVEGYLDVIGAVAAGIEGAVASMGTSLTEEQAALLARYAEEVVVGYDDDPAGENAMRRALPLLLDRSLVVRRCRFGAGHDPDSLRLEAGPEAVLAAVEAAGDAVELEIERLVPIEVHSDPALRSRAGKGVTELLGSVRDAVLRYGYIQRAADRLGVASEALLRVPGRRDARPAVEPPRDGGGENLVRSAEEKALKGLLLRVESAPSLEELPPEEAFLNPEARNIFRAIRDLYRDGGALPEPRQVSSAVAAEAATVDRLARILLEGPSALTAGELREAFAQLTRRWQQQRMRELAASIASAQQAGDEGLLRRLIEEKTELSLRRHRGAERESGREKD